MNLLHWNISGINSLKNLEPDFKDKLAEYDIVCLGETWIDEPFTLDYMNNFKVAQVKATSETKRGRPSGGILVFVKNTLEILEIISKNENWIFLLLKHENKTIVIGYVYIQPTKEKDNLLWKLNDELSRIGDAYKSSNIIIMGDFNARIGNLSTLTEVGISENEFVFNHRNSVDKKITNRGKKLLEVIKENSLVVLNGRVTKDYEGQITFSNHMGQSCIDLALVSADICNANVNLEVMESSSNHFPISINIGTTVDKNIDSKKKLKWKENNKVAYQESLTNSLKNNEILDYKQLVETIWDTADKTKMIIWEGRAREKPWFDYECFKARSIMNKTLRLCKKHDWNDRDRDNYLKKRNTCHYVKKRRNYTGKRKNQHLRMLKIV